MRCNITIYAIINPYIITDFVVDNTCGVEVIASLNRERKEDAMFFATNMIYDAYFTMNKDEWLNQENKNYRYATEMRFKEYWKKYKYLHDSIPQDVKVQIIMGIKNRMYGEGMVLESQTFGEWIKQIEVMV